MPLCVLSFSVLSLCFLSVASGLLHHAVTTIKEILSELPGSPRTQVGFITYDNTVQFYNLKHTMSQPQMMVCPDPDDR
jgi:protein transport protein SEC24